VKETEVRLRHLVIGGALAAASVLGFAAPAFAHDCYNPNKPAGAGVNYTIVGFGPDGPIMVQTGPGQGHGGFATLSPDLTGGQQAPDVHTLGSSSGPKEEVGGPGSMKPEHMCDGKGIDYLDCFAG
jgi:hypothetical protein